jgi:hypothetical protein
MGSDYPFFYSIPAEMFKSGEETDSRIPITIIPNQPTKDRVSDKILLKAYDEDCIKGFLFDGVLDYDHQSILGKTALEKAQAIIGEPEDFYVDTVRRVPVIKGFLFKGNPYVDNAIYPALKAKSNKIAASLGGRILQKSIDVDSETNQKVKAISKISLKHCAITPLQKAVHQGSSVMLTKSFSEDGECSYTYQFNSFDSFIKSFDEKNEVLEKALMAGNSTSIVKMTGGQILQPQSLEGVNYEKIKHNLPFIIENLISSKLIGKDGKQFINYLRSKGYSEEEAKETVELIAKNKGKILMLKK